MKKYIVLFTMMTITIKAEYKPMNVAAMQEWNEGNARNILLASQEGQKIFDRLEKLGKAVGAGAASVAYSVGYESTYGALVGAVSAAKAGAIIAAPWVAGGVLAGYGGYKTYRYFNPYVPTKQERIAQLETEFTDCLGENPRGTLNEHGFPARCSEVALSFALLAGSDRAKGMIDA
jgi:hypothetical protein